LTWDVTAPDTLAASHQLATSLTAGSAAEEATRHKTVKYSALLRTHDLVVIAVETLGPFNKDGADFISLLGRRLSAITGDPRETMFLFQRISVIAQRCNAASIMGSFLSTRDLGDTQQ
jgi:hypothetical protein